MIKVLCPTDFSEVALNAISYAAKFCKELDAQLTLFYVESMRENTNVELLRGKSLTIEAETEKLEELCHELELAFHISCNSEIQPYSAPIYKMISNRAGNFDLVIMGTNEAENMYKVFSGSNTYKLIQSATVPVLYIPNGYIYTPFNKIIYAFDYLHDFKLPLEQLKPYLKKFKSKLTVLQVTEPLDPQKTYELKEIQRQIRNEYLNELSIEFDTVQDTHIAQKIDEYASEKGAELLALCTHHYGAWENLFHKSVIKTICHKANYPVFVFHK